VECADEKTTVVVVVVADHDGSQERHAALVSKLRARFGSRTLSVALDSWKQWAAQMAAERLALAERAGTTLLQALLRAEKLRRLHLWRRRGVIRIQALQRGRAVRAHFAQLHAAARRIQARFRGRRWRELMKTQKPGRGLLRVPPADSAPLIEAQASPKRATCAPSTPKQLRKRASAQRLEAGGGGGADQPPPPSPVAQAEVRSGLPLSPPGMVICA
jgi:hypothetical protein